MTKAIVGLLVAAALATGCTREPQAPPSIAAAPAAPAARARVAPVETADAAPAAPLPDYLERLANGAEAQVRIGRDYAAAPAADTALLRSYPQWNDKGIVTGPAGERLTILTAKKVYAAGEEIRIVHVHEATKPGVSLYVMGPKEIFGEYVDGVLASWGATAPPDAYDGRVIESPGEDHNYSVSVHRLAPGVHRIEWRFATLSGPRVLRSNVLTVEVR